MHRAAGAPSPSHTYHTTPTAAPAAAPGSGSASAAARGPAITSAKVEPTKSTTEALGAQIFEAAAGGTGDGETHNEDGVGQEALAATLPADLDRVKEGGGSSGDVSSVVPLPLRFAGLLGRRRWGGGAASGGSAVTGAASETAGVDFGETIKAAEVRQVVC